MRRPVAMTVGLVTFTGMIAGLDTLMAVSAGQQSTTFYLLEIGAALVWSGVGALAAHIRVDRPGAGRLMQVFGLVLVLDAAAGFDMATSAPAVAAALVVAHAVQPYQIALFAHVLLAYPGGRPSRGDERGIILATYGWATVVSVVAAIDTVEVVTAPGWAGARPPGSVTGGPPSSPLMNGVWLTLTAVFLVVLAGKVGRATARERRVLAYPFGSAALILLLFLATVAGIDAGVPLAYVAVLVGPGAFLAGLFRERLGYHSVAQLVRTVENTEAGQLRAALRKALRDPSLRVGLAQPNGFVDESGEVTPPPAGTGRAALVIGADPPIAMVVHDASLVNEPELLAAVSAATRLVLDNARLNAVVREQLSEVRASRRRIIETGAEQRRLLERDLHDGAQQRMFAVGVALQLLERQLGDSDTAVTELITEARVELSAALRELRELARGIHPAVLTEQGLPAAVRMLSRRVPVPVRIDEAMPGRVEPAVESAAYFIVSEALTNVVKHSGATEVRVALRRAGDRVCVEVADNGRGGADPSRGTGLRGMADRAAAFDGTLTVADEQPSGTRITVELRCDSSSSTMPG